MSALVEGPRGLTLIPSAPTNTPCTPPTRKVRVGSVPGTPWHSATRRRHLVVKQEEVMSPEETRQEQEMVEQNQHHDDDDEEEEEEQNHENGLQFPMQDITDVAAWEMYTQTALDAMVVDDEVDVATFHVIATLLAGETNYPSATRSGRMYNVRF